MEEFQAIVVAAAALIAVNAGSAAIVVQWLKRLIPPLKGVSAQVLAAIISGGLTGYQLLAVQHVAPLLGVAATIVALALPALGYDVAANAASKRAALKAAEVAGK